jgi:PASTA domain
VDLMNLYRIAPLVLAAIAAVSLAGCTSGSAATPPPTTVTVTVPAPQPTSQAVAAESPTAASPATTQWEMPDVVGMNLQAAQDHLQSVTDYGVPLSTSTDATGQGRPQLMDRNWVVCSQSPAAGATLAAGDVPDLVVVKDDESC